MIGMHMGVWALFIIGFAVIYVGAIRFVSANGGLFFAHLVGYWNGGWFSYIALPLILGFGVTGLTWEANITAYLTIQGNVGRTLWAGVMASILLLCFYKMGKLTKTKERSVLIAATIGLVLAAILFLPFSALLQNYAAVPSGTNFWMANNFNNLWQNMKSELVPFDAYMNVASMVGSEVYQSPEYSIIAAVIGFVIMVVFSLLRQRYSWFIVTTTGVMLGTMFGSELWLPMLLAIVFKYLTLRVGGTRRYDSVGKPMAVGLLAGTTFIFVIQTLIWYANRMAVGAAYPA
jgi:hypothetical protein